VKSKIISLVVEGKDSSKEDECGWVWEERNVGSDPRNAVTQADLLGDTSKSLEAKVAI
jgi:hypothetical protein